MTEDRKAAVELKPCPFCGGVPLIQNGDSSVPGTGSTPDNLVWRQLVWCESCGTSSREYNYERSAVDAWNRRAPLPQPAEAGWRPIDTAPRDGVHILLAFGQDTVAEGWWDDGYDNELHPWKFVDTGGPAPPGGRPSFGFVNASRDEKYGPSHWRPLPTPPAADGEVAG